MKIDKRNKIQIGFTILTNSYFEGFLKGKVYSGKLKALCFPGLNCYSCPGALGSCPLGSLQGMFTGRRMHFSFYVIGILTMLGTIFGRLICGFLCPFGLFQDLLYKVKIFKKKKSLPMHKYLKYLKYIILLMFVILLPIFLKSNGKGEPYFCKLICPSGTLMAGWPLAVLNKSIRQSVGYIFSLKSAILISIIILSIKYYRPFCKYLCPLGAIYGFFNPIAIYRFKINENRCTKCKACTRACPMDIDVQKTPNSPECIRCQRCIKSCRYGALEVENPLKKEKEIDNQIS